MKRIINSLVALVLSLIIVLTFPLFVFADSVNSYNPVAGNGKGNTNSTNSDSVKQYGRLLIPAAEADVALYASYSQKVCDADDSACFYSSGKNVSGMTIVDHASQAFRYLTNVNVGDTATIIESNGGKIYLRCAEVYNGTNSKVSLLDNNGNVATGKHDYLTYCCLDSKGINIRICQWDIVKTENIDKKYDQSFNYDKNTLNKLISSMVNTESKKNNSKKKWDKSVFIEIIKS